MMNPGNFKMNLFKSISVIIFFIFLISLTSCKNPKEEPPKYPFRDFPLVDRGDPDFPIYSTVLG
jgi:hypothetical protein